MAGPAASGRWSDSRPTQDRRIDSMPDQALPSMALPRRVQAILWGVVVLFVAAVIAAATLLIERGRHDAITETEGRATRFVSGAEAGLNRMLLGVDVLLAGT